MIEYFFLTAKAFTIFSLGFGVSAVSNLKKKKEPTFTINHIFVGVLGLVLISWIMYLLFNNSFLNLQFYIYLILTFVILIKYKSKIYLEYIKVFIASSILFFVVQYFELNTTTNDSLAYFLTDGLDSRVNQFSLLLDFRSIPLIILSGYFDIINITYTSYIPGFINLFGILSLNSYLRQCNFSISNNILNRVFRFILILTPVLIFQFFYLNVHFLFGLLLTFILLQQSQDDEFNSIIHVIALSVFFMLRYEGLMLFLLFSFFFSKDKLYKNQTILKNIVISNIFLSITWVEIFSNTSTNTRGIGQVPESFVSILIYQFLFFVIYYLLIYKLDNVYIYKTLQIIFVLLIGLLLYLIGDHMTILNMFNPSGIWSITPLIFVVVIFYNILKDFYNVKTLAMLFIWIFISFVQTPQLFSGLDNLITDQIYYFLDSFFGTHTNNESICRDFAKSSSCQRTVIQVLIPMYFFSQYNLIKIYND
jgi:hypothetical protein